MQLLVVNSARVSLSKHSSSLSDADLNLVRFLYRNNHWTPFGHPQLAVEFGVNRVRLDRILMRRKAPSSVMVRAGNHTIIERGSLWHWLSNKDQYDHLEEDIDRALWDWVPDICRVVGVPERPVAPRLLTAFEIADDWASQEPERWRLPWITVAIRAPLPVRTQLYKHKFGFVENEVSRRYVDGPPRFFIPEVWRQRAPGVKQGSLPWPVRWHGLADWLARATYATGKLSYRALLALGVCPEQARFVLPEGRMTEWYWTGSLDAINRAVNLRTREHAQEETWALLQQIKEIALREWPKTAGQMIWKD